MEDFSKQNVSCYVVYEIGGAISSMRKDRFFLCLTEIGKE